MVKSKEDRKKSVREIFKIREEEKHANNLLISITWIGFTFYFEEGNFHEAYKKFLKIPDAPTGKHGSKLCEWFALTV